MAFGADLIAGFPTETESLFAETLDFVAAAGLHFLHVFPYSERPGTPAARMPSVPKPVRRERAARLREVGRVAARRFYGAQLGWKVSVLTEGGDRGHSQHFAPVRLLRSVAPGRIVQAHVLSANDDGLLAEPI